MSPFVPGAVAAAGANGSSGNSTRHPISRRAQARASGPRIPDRTSNDRFMAILPRRDDGPHRSRLSRCGGLNSADASDLVSEISPTTLVAGARRRNAAIHSLPVGRAGWPQCPIGAQHRGARRRPPGPDGLRSATARPPRLRRSPTPAPASGSPACASASKRSTAASRPDPTPTAASVSARGSAWIRLTRTARLVAMSGRLN